MQRWRATSVVLEVTDDKCLEKHERKHRQVDHAPHISNEAKLVKLADRSCNLRDILGSPPADWSHDRKQAYFSWAAKVSPRYVASTPGSKRYLIDPFLVTANLADRCTECLRT